jgi:hypothetical protein
MCARPLEPADADRGHIQRKKNPHPVLCAPRQGRVRINEEAGFQQARFSSVLRMAELGTAGAAKRSRRSHGRSPAHELDARCGQQHDPF